MDALQWKKEISGDLRRAVVLSRRIGKGRGCPFPTDPAIDSGDSWAENILYAHAVELHMTPRAAGTPPVPPWGCCRAEWSPYPFMNTGLSDSLQSRSVLGG